MAMTAGEAPYRFIHTGADLVFAQTLHPFDYIRDAVFAWQRKKKRDHRSWRG
jgi:hypothetical protein